MDKTPKLSNATITDKVVHHFLEPMSKQSTTSNEVTSRDKSEPNVIIVYSTSLGHAPLKCAQPAVVTRDQVQDMIRMAIESFVERQRQENEQFRLFMQNAITTQFSNLGVILLQNIQQAQMSMFGAVVAPVIVPALAPQPLEPSPHTFAPNTSTSSSSPPPTQPPPPFPTQKSPKIEKIPKKSPLQVTFSKRCLGPFKKASELCTLCEVEIAIMVFSPPNKAFSFGHLEVESLIDRYTTQNSPQESSAHHLIEAH
ncbi:hypothetical protein JHK84_045105 [Glycine max]|nr:hypothetical protein JHK86_045049 [Glycine max]KAG4951750.1 hypothetical protein JHK85_045617 [Glycine max]KAG5108198.1 hypothetical protein JHK84_045105 [Glycine max]